jgi:integrase/recombinase XerD
MTALAEQLERYLAVRRALGFQLIEHGRVLGAFVADLERNGDTSVTVGAALAWALTAATDNQAARRLSMLRRFAVYLSAFDPATEVPPTNLGPAGATRSRPYLYSPGEVGALLEAAAALRPERWAASVATLVGLVSATGIRPGEALRLDRGHVDLDAGHLAVMHSKFGKSRQLPLHPTTVRALGAYAEVRDRTVEASEAAFFVNRSGSRITNATASATFRALLAAAAISAPPGRRPPRLYDFRHSFAVDTVLGWHRDGLDVGCRLPMLSAYLGHLRPANTHWYLEASPELMAQVAVKLARSWEPRP